VSAELQLDKSDWKPVTFGDVVKEVRQSTKDPVADGIEHVVGLEHIEPECIHLRNWASIEEETTFTKTFRKGHVLFGRRRAYLKKAAQAEFDGICSGDITVMEAKDDLLPELLPFLVCNDKFFDYAVQHSAGGLSPRTKFKDLANYEFFLPPKDQQAKLAELLWAADGAAQDAISLKSKLIGLGESYLFDEILPIWNGELNRPTEFKKLDDLLKTSICNGVFKKQTEFGSGTLLINVTDIYGSFAVDPSTLDRVFVSEKEQESFSARPGDLIFNRSSLVKDGIGHTCIVPDYSEAMVFECHLMRARIDDSKADPRFVCRYCLSPFGRNYLISRSQTTTMTTLNQFFLGRMPIPSIPLREQVRIADLLDENDAAIAKSQAEVDTSVRLQKSLINQIF
jgi:type I restriction enzyme S subunit